MGIQVGSKVGGGGGVRKQKIIIYNEIYQNDFYFRKRDCGGPGASDIRYYIRNLSL